MNASVDRNTTGMHHLKIDLCLIIRIGDSSPQNTGVAGSLAQVSKPGPSQISPYIIEIIIIKKFEVCLSV